MIKPVWVAMIGTRRRRLRKLCCLCVVAFGMSACHAESTTGVVSDGTVTDSIAIVAGGSETFTRVAVGQRVNVTLFTVGPGEFDSLPTLSSSNLRFLDVAVVGPYVPAGPRQLFRFTAAAPGRVVVSFQHSEGIDGKRYVVVDTIEIR